MNNTLAILDFETRENGIVDIKLKAYGMQLIQDVETVVDKEEGAEAFGLGNVELKL